MMQFLILGYDGADALSRRLALRDAHITLANQLKAAGNLLYGAAMLDEQGRMTGSMLVTAFGSREDVNGWLEREPYVTGKVWDRVEVIPCRVGPMFGVPGK